VSDRFNTGNQMSVDEFNARNSAEDWSSPWDTVEKRLVTYDGDGIIDTPTELEDLPDPIRSDPIKCDPKHQAVASGVTMSPDFLKGRRIFKVLIQADVLSTNRLYVVTWAPAGKVTAVPKKGGVYRYLGSGNFMPVRSLRVKTKEHKEWKAGVVRQLRASSSAVPGCVPPNTECYVRIWVHGNWRTKDLKKIRRKDLGNCEKALLDTIFEHVKADDSVLFTIYMAKVADRVSAFTVEIGTLMPKFGAFCG